MTFKNKALAMTLWGENKDNETWENIYLVDEMKKFDLSYEKFNRIVEYKPNYGIQGFNVLNEKLSERVINRLKFTAIIM